MSKWEYVAGIMPGAQETGGEVSQEVQRFPGFNVSHRHPGQQFWDRLYEKLEEEEKRDGKIPLLGTVLEILRAHANKALGVLENRYGGFSSEDEKGEKGYHYGYAFAKATDSRGAPVIEYIAVVREKLDEGKTVKSVSDRPMVGMDHGFIKPSDIGLKGFDLPDGSANKI